MHHDLNQQKGTKAPPSIIATLHLHPSNPAPFGERVSVWRKVAYGAGGLTDFLFLNMVNALAVPIYSIALKMDPLFLGIALAAPRVVGAILDPVVGTVSDNARTRWGRRRPFIVCGAVIGARWLGVIVGLVMLAGAMATVVACRENTETIAKQPKIDLRATLSFTLRNRPFLLLQSVTVILVLGLGCEGVIGSYIHIYYTSQGSKTFASYVTGIGGTLTIFSTLAALSFGLWLSTHTGKRHGALVGLLIALIGVCLMPFLLVPAKPYLIMVEWVILAFGLPCANLMFSSMTADICDEDELVTGLRREGAFVAVGGFFGKVAQVATLLLAGALPRMAGYVDTSVPPTLRELKVMRAILIGVQFVAILAAITIIWFYPLTRSRSEATRRLLDERRRQAADD